MIPEIEVEGHRIGVNHEPVVVAEIGINHGGSLEVAKSMVLAAHSAGVRFVKHQTHMPRFEMSKEAEHAIPGNATSSIFDIISRNCLTMEEELELARFARSLGLVYFSTPFSREAADFLAEDVEVSVFKIGSGECNNYPLVSHIAKKGRPVILSTGMNSINSIKPAADILRSEGVPFALLHTTNLYPTPLRLVRIAAMAQLGDAFPDAVIGLSDHSTSNSACFAGVAMGASIVERHFTDSKSRRGPDIICSMDSKEAEELLRVTKEIRLVSGGTKEAAPEEDVTINFAFSSLASLRDIDEGEIFSDSNIFPIRPNGGFFGPKDFQALLGKRASRKIVARTQLLPEDIVDE